MNRWNRFLQDNFTYVAPGLGVLYVLNLLFRVRWNALDTVTALAILLGWLGPFLVLTVMTWLAAKKRPDEGDVIRYLFVLFLTVAMTRDMIATTIRSFQEGSENWTLPILFGLGTWCLIVLAKETAIRSWLRQPTLRLEQLVFWMILVHYVIRMIDGAILQVEIITTLLADDRSVLANTLGDGGWWAQLVINLIQPVKLGLLIVFSSSFQNRGMRFSPYVYPVLGLLYSPVLIGLYAGFEALSLIRVSNLFSIYVSVGTIVYPLAVYGLLRLLVRSADKKEN